MQRERVSLDDLMSAARQQGLERSSDVRIAVLETNGRISFFTDQGRCRIPRSADRRLGTCVARVVSGKAVTRMGFRQPDSTDGSTDQPIGDRPERAGYSARSVPAGKALWLR
jgi:hypothetical protein